MDGSEFILYFLIFLLGGCVGALIMVGVSEDIGISQETGNDICKNLTRNESAVAYEIREDDGFSTGKLGCDIPSYDSTQNIIIKSNRE